MTAYRFDDWQPPEIEHNVATKWGWMVAHPENFTLGRNTDIGFGTYIGAHTGVEIGDKVQIGSHCAIYSLNTIDNQEGAVIIKKGACIGANSVIAPNVIIGANAKIGALSFVRFGTRILPNEKWVGIPAKRTGVVDAKNTVF